MGEAVDDGSREEGKAVVGSKPQRITAIVVAPGSGQRTFGVLKGLTLEAAQIATSIPLAVGQTFRFRLFLEAPPAMAERHGRVLWTEAVLNPAERLVAESRVQWVTATEAREPSLEEADEEGAA